MEAWLLPKMSDKQREQFKRDCEQTIAVGGNTSVSVEWGESPEAVAAQDTLGAVTPTYGFID